MPSALSILDIIHTIYTVTLGPSDRCVLSKGHGCLALYAVLEATGRLPSHVMESFCQRGSELLGHPERRPAWGIECTSGSLGHGAAMSVGMALGKKIKTEPGRILCVIGDGECEEGIIYESMHIASRLRLSNLVWIIDNNKTSPNRIDGEPFVASLAAKFSAFGWIVHTANGHDQGQIECALEPSNYPMPVVLIANTVKGHGVPEMEAEPQLWHHHAPKREMVESENTRA